MSKLELSKEQQEWVDEVKLAITTASSSGCTPAHKTTFIKGVDAYVNLAESFRKKSILSEGPSGAYTYAQTKEWGRIYSCIFSSHLEVCYIDEYIESRVPVELVYLSPRDGNKYVVDYFYMRPDLFSWGGMAWQMKASDKLMYSGGENVMNHLTFKSCKDENVTRDTKQLGIPYLGVELEVESKDQDRDKACREILIQCNGKLTGDKANNFIMLKTDGSLDGRKGIEIVTAPATLKYHKQAWKKFFDKDAKGACDLVHSFDNTNNRCGMHVHISRNAFTALSFGKFLQFINDEANLGFITKIAGRSKSHYTKFIKKKVTDCMNPVTGDKYEAVNLRHSNTLEIRIFKGNSRKEGFFKNIEFVHAVWNFSNDTGLKQLSYTDFLKWIPGKQYEYPYLTAWLIFNGYLSKDILPTSGVNTAAYSIIEKNIAYRKKVKSKKAAQAKKKANSRHRIIEIVSKDTYVQPKTGEVDTALASQSTSIPTSVAIGGTYIGSMGGLGALQPGNVLTVNWDYGQGNIEATAVSPNYVPIQNIRF